MKEQGFVLDDARFEALLNQFNVQLAQAGDVTSLLMQEAHLTKALFKLAADTVGYGEFSRARRGSGSDASKISPAAKSAAQALSVA